MPRVVDLARKFEDQSIDLIIVAALAIGAVFAFQRAYLSRWLAPQSG